MTTTTIEPIRKEIRVAASQATAFETFTARMGSWWNPEYTIASEPIADVVIEPRAGGRWYERGADGTECDWGTVLAWEPDERIVLDWQITADWKHEPSLHTELEVRFLDSGSGSTRVELEHRGLDAFGEQASMMREIFDSPGGWAGLLDLYSAAVGTS
jgi:uncharacterized protein YndB with AHSA1/START domain